MQEFPSPLGELWIWMLFKSQQKTSWGSVSVPARGIMNLNLYKGMKKITVDNVSVPARGIMNLNTDRISVMLDANVSVPARGIMNLNTEKGSGRTHGKGFRPRSGNYESESLSDLSFNTRLRAVSVPARGIMNLNTITKIKRELGLWVSVPARGIMNLNANWFFNPYKKTSVSVPARGIMNLNSDKPLLIAQPIQRFRPRSGNYESEWNSQRRGGGRMKKFPSPLGELWIWIILQKNFNSVKAAFPSPLGELWIWMPTHLG